MRCKNDAAFSGLYPRRRAQAAGSINLRLPYRTLRAEQAGTGASRAIMARAPKIFSTMSNDWLVEGLKWGKSGHTKSSFDAQQVAGGGCAADRKIAKIVV